MAKDNRRSNKVKEDENVKSKKKMVKQDASSSSSRRSSRETSSSKQRKEISTKENVSNTRKSVRLEKKDPSGTPESKEKLKGTQEKVITSPVKKIDRRKKTVEKPASSKKKSVKSLKQCVVDTSGDKRYGKRSLKAGGKKKKRGVSTGLDKSLSKRQRIRTEAGDDDNDKESEEKSSESNSSSSKDVDTEQEKPGSSKSVEDKDDSDDECSDMKEEESTVKASKKERRSSHSCLRNSDVEVSDVKEEENSDVEVIDVKEESIESGNEAPVSDKSSSSERKTDPDDCTDIKDLCDTSSSKDRRTCEVAGLAKIVKEKNGLSRTGTSTCIVCKQGGNLRYCEAVGCNRCYHLSCLDPSVNNVPVDNICPFCVKNTKSSAPLVSGMPESIWDTRELEVSDAEGPKGTKFVEFWVPVQISNLQLEQYCSMLLSNAMALSSCSKSDTVGTLHDILVSNRKCCDHPYIVDQSLQGVLTKDLEPIKFLDVGIKASGKLQLLDLILPELRKRQLRVLILFQPLSGSGKDSASIGDILDDFVRQRFGEDSYERVDGIGMIPSKKQAALSNFNNKEMGRFVFLLEHRACLPSIKLSSVDTIIIFDSDWNPANDLRALQRIAIDSQLEQITVFRLYTSSTLEEKILRLAENNVTIDSKLQNLSRSTSDALLMWGATHLFKRLSEFHSSSVVNISSEEYCWNELMEEFLSLISHKSNKKDTSKLIITRVQPICGTYGKNLTITELADKEEPHTFWRKLLVERNPCWKYLPTSTPRQRTQKRSQYFEETPKKTNAGSDDVGRKRKKSANNIIEPVAVKPVTEEGEVAVTCGDAISNEMSFRDLLKLKISKLCEVLRLSEDVKIMVERFLEYVIENYRVNKEPTNTLHAFLISLCWIGSELLKHKLDWKQSVALANEHLNFSCKEEEAKSVYEKLEPAKEMFLLHSENHKKTNVSKDSMQVDSVVVKVLDADCNKEVAEETVQENEVQRNPETVAETSNLQTLDDVLEALSLQPNEEPSFLTVAENQSNIPQALETTAEQVSNQAESNLMNGQSQRSDNQNQRASQTPNQSPDPLQFELEKFCELKNTINKFHEAIKLKLKSDHEKELEEMIAQMNLKYEAKRQEAETAFQLKKNEIDIGFNRVVRNKILAETYRSKCNDLSPFDPTGRQAIQTGGMQHLPRFHMRISSGVTSTSPAQSSGSHQVTDVQPPLQIINQTAQLFSTTPNRSPSTMPSRPPLSITVPTSTPSRPPSTTVLSSIPIRPPSTTIPNSTSSRPPSTTTATTTPNKPPLSTTIPTDTPSRPPPSTTTPNSTSSRQPSTNAPTSTPNRPPPSTTIPTDTPSRSPPSTTTPNSTPIRPPSTTVSATTQIRPPPGINPMTPSRRLISRPPSNNDPINSSSRYTTRPPPNMNPTTLLARNPQATAEIRTPAPHIRPFTPTTSMAYRPMSSNFPNFLQTSTQPPRPPSLQPAPPFPTNHNGHPTQNSPRSSPLSSSQPPSSVAVAPPVSFLLPSLYSWLPSEQHPPPATSSSLPPMPSISNSNTGLYSASGGSESGTKLPSPSFLKQSALDLLTDIDKQAGLYRSNYFTSSSSGVLDLTELGQEADGGNDLVCLSDDD